MSELLYPDKGAVGDLAGAKQLIGAYHYYVWFCMIINIH